ncbi:FkbM family methyltransferase [Candidatus Viadribacter manganicus]|uniref:FkbM family methyltransferase n=1 Tax=Candidatus Viadribacter manganicus TaxID=1759059 RepID=UPI001D17AD14|nr:FkbM family methyltransferase [Candidatus Viadribacter manganicus]
MNAALTRIANSGVQVASTIKIGAGSGADVPHVERFFPGSRTLLVEMDATFEPQWRSLQAKIPSLAWAICGAADEDRDGYMRKNSLTGGKVAQEPSADATRIMHRRIDTLVREHQMQAPYFLRFDTHGAEMLVLAGATETLKDTSLIQMECYNFKHTMTFDKMVGSMRERGFRVIDMCEPLFRSDGAFWQVHLFFARDDHKAFKDNSFHVA